MLRMPVSANSVIEISPLKMEFRMERRFPAPWRAEEYRGISYIVRDANNFALAYVYFESEPGRRAAARLMTKDEARRIAAGIAKVPELLKPQD
jgi:hypothetical protein